MSKTGKKQNILADEVCTDLCIKEILVVGH